jgi:hypothetical protein
MTERQICSRATGETPHARIIGFIGADRVVATDRAGSLSRLFRVNYNPSP